MSTPQNDPIAEMTPDQIIASCHDIFGVPPREFCSFPKHQLIVLIIEKLQEWGYQITWHPTARVWKVGSLFEHENLQVVFLLTAQREGHWTHPQKKVEDIRKRDLRIVVDELDDLHERLERLETFIAKRSEQFPDLR